MSDIQLRRLLYSFRDANLRCQNRSLKFSVLKMPIERSSQKSASAFEFTCFVSCLRLRGWLVSQQRAGCRLAWPQIRFWFVYSVSSDSYLFSSLGFYTTNRKAKHLVPEFRKQESVAVVAVRQSSSHLFVRVSRGQAKLISPLRSNSAQ